ncbi:hypothetical protein SAMN05428996_1670 [Quadrisphaera sp. DSM 44207]|nr:hypothetical protein SAMN05428996_1670 [Quadrisphaera sp. DSM 44207]
MRLDASEVDPDAGATAQLPGYAAADRTAPGEGAVAGPGDPSQEPPVGPPAQDATTPGGA